MTSSSSARRPSRGSDAAGDTLLKRIIGLPGETVHEDAQGFVEIDGRKLAEPYVEAERRGADVSNRNRTWHVRHGEYFTMGDNRGSSCDSRVWGGVPRENVIGEVIAIYWPPRRIGRP